MARRVADPSDRRRVRIEVTPKLWELTGPLMGPFIAESQSILDDYSTEELERFAEFLSRVIEVQGKYTERIREM
jgi:DNA-binding MarR family transcriptional regulator